MSRIEYPPEYRLKGLHHYGLMNNTLSWIKDVLSNRTQDTALQLPSLPLYQSHQSYPKAQFKSFIVNAIASEVEQGRVQHHQADQFQYELFKAQHNIKSFTSSVHKYASISCVPDIERDINNIKAAQSPAESFFEKPTD
ncbi:hypothetical protein CHS0354_006565 [Potamilus streckersoni]|uniref:Uncharacterized protein n=1 Tax=Potamilus streckersoni TaxID=2493646 RepID=A0AAE0WC55_9BIVA|nr:hypothetical protein CHS0354_006565 [Potamilus streckersoni]